MNWRGYIVLFSWFGIYLQLIGLFNNLAFNNLAFNNLAFNNLASKFVLIIMNSWFISKIILTGMIVYSKCLVKHIPYPRSYYFSPSNLQGDFFLRSQMDHEGWVALTLIASFYRIRNMTTDLALIAEVCGSEDFHLDFQFCFELCQFLVWQHT